jgi:hypothetical protein
MKIRHQQTGETIEVPVGKEQEFIAHIKNGGDPMQLLGNKKKVKLNLKKHQQGGEQMQQQGGDQQAQMQQLVQMAAQALSQGADPQQVAQMLMQKGVPQEIVQQVIQAAMQDLQQQGQQQASQEQMLQEQEMQQQPQMNYGGYMQNGGEKVVNPYKKYPNLPFNANASESDFTKDGKLDETAYYNAYKQAKNIPPLPNPYYNQDSIPSNYLNTLKRADSMNSGYGERNNNLNTGAQNELYNLYKTPVNNMDSVLNAMEKKYPYSSDGGYKYGGKMMQNGGDMGQQSNGIPSKFTGDRRYIKGIQNAWDFTPLQTIQQQFAPGSGTYPANTIKKKKNGGYMQQGGLTDWWMQAGGQKKITFADIEKMYQQIGKPAGASALTDYPPTYTYEPKPKVKIIPKKVYTPQTYQELPPSKIIDYPPTYTQTKENGGYMAEGGFVKGQQYEMDDNQIAHLKSLGYKIKEV